MCTGAQHLSTVHLLISAIDSVLSFKLVFSSKFVLLLPGLASLESISLESTMAAPATQSLKVSFDWGLGHDDRG